MSDGTTIPVYVPRLHKSNAESEKQDTEDYIKSLELRIVAMAANGGMNFMSDDGEPWYEHVSREIPSLLEEYRDACFKNTMAYLLVDDPDSCEDELHKGLLSEPDQSWNRGTAKADAFMRHVAGAVSDMLGEEVRWVNVPDSCNNPLCETGFFSTCGGEKVSRPISIRQFM